MLKTKINHTKYCVKSTVRKGGCFDLAWDETAGRSTKKRRLAEEENEEEEREPKRGDGLTSGRQR
jgi:hypothetical protein